jgi:hypothetical protein
VATKHFTLSQESLNSILIYKDGLLYWKVNRGNVKAGSIAGCHAFKGYHIVRIGGKNHYFQRVIFMMHHGYLPVNVDHIDGNPANNRIENLRAATRSQNGLNQKIHKRNKSGFRGVSWNQKMQKWIATCQIDNKQKYLGCFESVMDAAEIVEKFRLQYHGEFYKSYHHPEQLLA